MKKPKMILFDYGQTLVHERTFDGVKGTQAVLDFCAENPNNISAETVQALANELNQEMGRFDPATSHLSLIEVHNHLFQNYLYQYFNIRLHATGFEVETTFWDAASPGKPTKHITEFLEYLENEDIRTGVISNISYSGTALTNRIRRFFPDHPFEFILATSEYVFRKPSRRIYELALRKAELEPDDVWYCGDNAICDVEGAMNAGLTPVWYHGALTYAKHEPKCDCIRIGDWMELKEILENTEGIENQTVDLQIG